MLKAKVLALDLEGTLVSNAVSQFPRPGLFGFLSYCYRKFERVVFFTSVGRERTLEVLSRLVDDGLAPREVLDSFEYVEWSGSFKNLDFIRGAQPQEVLLLDDQEQITIPDQRDRWLPVVEFVYPYSSEDRELDRVRDRLEKMLSGTA